MKCEFVQLSPGRVKCQLCGREVVTPDPPERVHATCRAARSEITPLAKIPKTPCLPCGDVPAQLPTIGVVIPTFNCRDYLERCIASWKAQTLKPAKLIIVDDGSTDGTRELLEQLGLQAATEKSPGIVARAQNYAAATVRRLFDRRVQTDDVTAARLQICQGCPSRDPERDTCRECGCPLAQKAALPTEQCPRGFWADGFPIEMISHEINRGANAARQTGLDQLQTDWVVLADADAEYDPNYLERLIAASQEDPAADLIYCTWHRIREDTGVVELIRGEEWDPARLWWSNYISMSSLIRRARLQINTERVHLDGLDDWAMWMQLAGEGHHGKAVHEILFRAWERPTGKTGLLRRDPPALRREVAYHRRRFAGLIGCTEPISIVIPYFNCADLLEKCLEHLRDYCGLPFEVLVIDNGSTEAVPHVEGLDPIVIRNATNQGFTRACNQGFRISQGRHVLLLNSDCYVGPDCVEKLYSHLVSKPRIAAVGPMTNDGGHQSLQPGSRSTLTALDGARAVAGPPRASSLDMLAFFCTLIHRDAVAAIGLQDGREVFRSGLGADDEWCYRARQAGWQCLLARDAFAEHLGGQSFRRNGIDRAELQRPAIAAVQQILSGAHA